MAEAFSFGIQITDPIRRQQEASRKRKFPAASFTMGVVAALFSKEHPEIAAALGVATVQSVRVAAHEVGYFAVRSFIDLVR